MMIIIIRSLKERPTDPSLACTWLIPGTCSWILSSCKRVLVHTLAGHLWMSNKAVVKGEGSRLLGVKCLIRWWDLVLKRHTDRSPNSLQRQLGLAGKPPLSQGRKLGRGVASESGRTDSSFMLLFWRSEGTGLPGNRACCDPCFYSERVEVLDFQGAEPAVIFIRSTGNELRLLPHKMTFI